MATTATLQKEIWVSQLMQNFYPDSSFLGYAKDFSALVDFNAINIAETGVDPEVLINNTTYPIKVTQRIDKPIRIELDLFETENTLVRHPEIIEYSYDQLESVLMGHRNRLRPGQRKKPPTPSLRSVTGISLRSYARAVKEPETGSE